MKNSSKNNGEKDHGKNWKEKKNLVWWSLAGLELATTGFRVRVLTVKPKRHLVVSEAKMDSKSL